jgi:hypothetical protein
MGRVRNNTSTVVSIRKRRMLSRPTQTHDAQNEKLSTLAARYCQQMSEEKTDDVANGDVVHLPIEYEQLKLLHFSSGTPLAI